MKDQILASRYIQALVSQLEATDQEAVLSGLNAIFQGILESDSAWDFFRSPTIPKDAKIAGFKDLLAQRKIDTPKAINFCKILVNKNRISLLPALRSEIERSLNLANNVTDAEIYVSTDLNDALKQHLVSNFESYIQKRINPKFIKQEDILGGFKIKIENTIFDGSVGNALTNFKSLVLEKNK